MRTFTPGDRLEEHASTFDDHGEDRRKNALDLEREQRASMRRVTEATGASAHELRQLMQRLRKTYDKPVAVASVEAAGGRSPQVARS